MYLNTAQLCLHCVKDSFDMLDLSPSLYFRSVLANDGTLIPVLIIFLHIFGIADFVN